MKILLKKYLDTFVEKHQQSNIEEFENTQTYPISILNTIFLEGLHNDCPKKSL